MSTNVTLSVPTGSYVANNLLCTPASWTDILTFYLSNYVVHVASVQFLPGEHGFDAFAALLLALLFPTAGLARGLDRVIRSAILGKTPLQKAARAGALCMVVRAQGWQPTVEQTLVDVSSTFGPPSLFKAHFTRTTGRKPYYMDLVFLHPKQDQPTDMLRHDTDGTTLAKLYIYIYKTTWQSLSGRVWSYMEVASDIISGGRMIVYGHVRLPPGYALAFVPHDASVKTFQQDRYDADPTTSTPADAIDSSYNALAGISGIVQLLFGLTTLYNTVGPQIDRFGYAAFGLTVLPFTFMSLINLFGTIATPTYAAVYLVESDIIKEARTRGAQFKGVVGTLAPADSAIDTLSPDNILRRFEVANPNTLNLNVIRPHKVTDSSSRVDPLNMSSPTAIRTGGNGMASQPDQSSGTTPTASVSLADGPEPVRKEHVLAYTLPGSKFVAVTREPTTVDKSSWTRLEPLAEANVDAICVPAHPPFARSLSYQENEMVEQVKQLHPRLGNLSWTTTWICFIMGAIPLLPLGILTRFNAGSSTIAQRVIVMLWFTMGVYIGTFVAAAGAPVTGDTVLPQSHMTPYFRGMLLVLKIVLFGASSIAGYVEVGLMYSSFGTCFQVS